MIFSTIWEVLGVIPATPIGGNYTHGEEQLYRGYAKLQGGYIIGSNFPRISGAVMDFQLSLKALLLFCVGPDPEESHTLK